MVPSASCHAHINKGYEIWAEAIELLLVKLLGDAK